MPFGPVRPRPAEAQGDVDLVAILRRCAGGDPEGVAELWAWQGGRIARTYARLVRDPELAEGGLAAVLGVLAREARGYDPTRGPPAEDWVFGRLRRLALEPPAARPAEPPAPAAANHDRDEALRPAASTPEVSPLPEVAAAPEVAAPRSAPPLEAGPPPEVSADPEPETPP
ncbi:MAG TPA: hypothetical protein VF606_09915, partial [Geminicoccaceae bacterium]